MEGPRPSLKNMEAQGRVHSWEGKAGREWSSGQSARGMSEWSCLQVNQMLAPSLPLKSVSPVL